MTDFLNNNLKRRRGSRIMSRRSRSKSGWLIILILFFIAAAAVGLVYFVLPTYLKTVGITFVPPFMHTPTPAPTVEVTATPNPYLGVDFSELQQEVIINAVQYKWFGEPCAYNGAIVFTAGELVNNSAKMTTLYKLDAESGSSIRLNIELENDHFLYPVFNDDRLVFLDAKNSGGGNIVCYKMVTGATFGAPTVIKKVYAGQPQLFLDGDYLVWTERTGSYMDKLFMCDLSTGETVTVQMFEKGSYYGTSKPYIKNGCLVWADAESETASGGIISRICLIDVKTGGMTTFMPNTYVHDPKTNGKGTLAWLDGNHGKDTNLYVSAFDGTPELVAKNVVDFYMGDNFIAYESNDKVYVYIIADKESHELTQRYQSGQIMSAGDGIVVWTDTTSRERDVLKYARIPS